MVIQGINKVIIISQNIIIYNGGIFIERLSLSLFLTTPTWQNNTFRYIIILITINMN